MLEVLPKSGMTANGQLYQLSSSAHAISEKDGFASLPTPTASDSYNTRDSRKRFNRPGTKNYSEKKAKNPSCQNLHTALSMLPTPTATDPDKQSTVGLHRLLVMGTRYSKGDYRNLPTPMADDANHTPNKPALKRKEYHHLNAIAGQTEEAERLGKRARLNPRFVRWMMGFPIGWLDLEP